MISHHTKAVRQNNVSYLNYVTKATLKKTNSTSYNTVRARSHIFSGGVITNLSFNTYIQNEKFRSKFTAL